MEFSEGENEVKKNIKIGLNFLPIQIASRARAHTRTQVSACVITLLKTNMLLKVISGANEKSRWIKIATQITSLVLWIMSQGTLYIFRFKNCHRLRA